MGQIVRNCSLIQRPIEKKGGKRHHVHTDEDVDTPKKVSKEDESSDEEYVLISSLTGIVTHGSDIWLVDSGASKHMIGYKDSLSNLTHNNSPHKVKLEDDYQYQIKGVVEASYKLDSRNPMKMKEVLYVLGLKKNLLSISTLGEKGYKASFFDGKVLMFSRGNNCDDDVVIGVQEGGLYKLKGRSNSTLIHDIVNPNKLSHRRFSDLHYKALPSVINMVTGLLEIQENPDDVCKGCA